MANDLLTKGKESSYFLYRGVGSKVEVWRPCFTVQKKCEIISPRVARGKFFSKYAPLDCLFSKV